MIYITDEMIENAATNSQTYKRGVSYYKHGRVIRSDFSEDDLHVSALVYGGEIYNVDIDFLSTGEVEHVSCSCPAFYQYDGACKHVVAVFKLCQQRWHEEAEEIVYEERLRNSRVVENILEHYEYNTGNGPKKFANLEVTFEVSYDEKYLRRGFQYALSLRMGEERLYVVKNVRKLLEAMESGESMVFGKGFIFDPLLHAFHPKDKPIVNLLREIYEIEQNFYEDDWGLFGGHSGGKRVFKGKQVTLTEASTKRLFPLLPSGGFNIKIIGREYKNVELVEEDLPLHFTLDKKGDRLVLQWEKMNLMPLLETGEYFFYDGRVYSISNTQRDNFAPIFAGFLNFPSGIQFSEQEKERFVAEALPVLKTFSQVDITPALQENLYEAGLKAEVYLNQTGDAVEAEVKFIYGEIVINPFYSQSELHTGDKILVRDMVNERAILNLFEKAEFTTLKGKLYLEDAKVFDFVYYILPEIQQLAEVFYSEKFRSMRVRNAAAFKGGVSLNEESDLLEFSFQVDDIDMAELRNVFNSLREKKKYHRLQDGSFLPLDESDSNLHQLMTMINALNISDRDLKNEVIELPKYRAAYIDRCLRESTSYVEKNVAFKQLVQDITEPQDVKFDLPTAFNGVLRDYQKIGYRWLKVLAMYGLGGILADDMGLGKTIQAIAFILSEKERLDLPALVIVPTSVVYNWQDEANKFAPALRAVVVSGTPKERKLLLEEVQDVDLVITSYALMRRDIEFYKKINFGYCFLDEAQHIKNAKSLTAKLAKTIQARGYFALTGTPLENSLSELWSIFDFVMPGYLLSHRKFTQKYERPIIKNQDEKSLTELQKQIAPFILRRMKRDVLQELPPKFESRILTDLTREQKKIYLTYLQQAKGEIEESIAVNGFARSQIRILAVLTRLRQICCHPATFLENYQGSSGKLQTLAEIMQNAMDGGHRVLLFSQFTGMLKIIQKQLNDEGIKYFYLDGSTKMEQRGQMVREFNQGEREVFLISLKAGGTGLNLTGADMVIHYDPWWNPAVEDQATDRAYRIGQKNSVQVISLITKGTIEEKIYELQQKKKAMIESVIKPGETMLSKMSEQEIRELLDMVAV